MERLRQLISRRAGLTSVGLQHEMASEAPHVSDRAMRRYRAALDLTPRRQRITATPIPQHEQLRRGYGSMAVSNSCGSQITNIVSSSHQCRSRSSTRCVVGVSNGLS
jgi:hypothetical protein